LQRGPGHDQRSHYNLIPSLPRSICIDSGLASTHMKHKTHTYTSEKPALVMTRPRYCPNRKADVSEQRSETLRRSMVFRAINFSIWQPLRRLHINSSLDAPTLERLLQVPSDARSDEDPFSISEYYHASSLARCVANPPVAQQPLHRKNS
jgi:hypothetical protein